MKVVVLNEKKINFDGKVDLSIISNNTELYDYTKDDEIIDRSIDAEILVVKEMKLTKEIINKLPSSVKMICEAGTGYDNIDIEECKNKNIIVTNIPNYASISVAEYIVTFMLMLSKMNYVEEISGKTLGVIGTGNIGNELIELLKGFNMNIIGYSKDKNNSIKYVELEELLSTSDYISVNLPLTEETYHLLDKDKLSLIKKGACLINTSRGKVINETDLIELLDKNILKGVALDVLEEEPIKSDNKLLNRKNVILTPHIGWSSIEARNRLINTLKENIESYQKGIYINKVN